MNTNFVIPFSNITVKNKTEIGVPPLELAELMSANVPIPQGFVITQAALEEFALNSQLDQKVKQLQQMGSFSEISLTKLILESDLPKEIHIELSREFSALSGISNIWLKLRAGLFDHSGIPLSFIDESEVNEVKGYDALELEVKKIWAKLLILDQKYDSLGSFIIVQKSIPAEVSGLIYTQDKLANNSDHILVKCIYGEYNKDLKKFSDTYVFSKSQEKIIDRAIVPQAQMSIRSNKNDFGYEQVEISEKWQMRQKLSDKYIEDLSYLADYLENVFTKPQEVSWVFQAGKIWINYVRPLTTQLQEELEVNEVIEVTGNINDNISEESSNNINDNASPNLEEDKDKENEEHKEHENVEEMNSSLKEDIAIVEELEKLDAIVEQQAEYLENESIDITLPDNASVNINITNNTDTDQSEDFEVRISSAVKDVLVVGVGNNKGVIEGKVVFDRDQSTATDILVLPEWDEMPKNAAGIIIEDLIRIESGIPIVYGAELAAKILREGEFVRLDTDTGFVFELTNTIKESPSSLMQNLDNNEMGGEVSNETNNEVNNETKQEGEDKEHKDIPLEDTSKDLNIITETSPQPSPFPIMVTPVIPVVPIPSSHNINNEVEVIEQKHELPIVKKIDQNLIKVEDSLNQVGQVDVNKIEHIDTAIKVFAKVNSLQKEELINTDGYILDLPHASDYFNSKDKIDYKSISNLIYSYTLPFLEYGKNPVIYNIFDALPATYIKNTELLDVQCEAIHKLRSKENMRQLFVALPRFKNLKQLREFRKSLSAAGLRRSTTFKVYIKIAYASNVFELSKYLEDKFDGVIVHLETLYSSLYSTNKKLNFIPDTLISALTQMQKECKSAKVPMIIDLSGVKIKKQMLQKLAPFIHYGISVNAIEITPTKVFISNLEKERIFK